MHKLWQKTRVKFEDPALPCSIRTWLCLLSGSFSWLWALVVLVVLLLIRWIGDRWWGVTLLLFIPRWLFLSPLPILALVAGVARRPRHWIIQSVVALVIAGPLMGVSLPVHQLLSQSATGLRLRVMTLNRGTSQLDLLKIIRLIEQERIDVICFQEGTFEDRARLQAYLEANGWHRDQRGYLASRYPITSELPPLPDEVSQTGRHSANLVRVRIRPPGGVDFAVASIHMPTLRFGLYRFLELDLTGFQKHVAWWDRQIVRILDGLAEVRDVPLVVGGDFNVPPDQATMVALGSFFRFAFEDAGWGYGYTRPAHYPWLRIDHILATPQWVFTGCWVGPDVGSDHLPLIAEAILPATFDTSRFRSPETSVSQE